MSIPDRYLSGLSGEERRRRAAEIKRGKKTKTDDKSAYSPSRFKTDEGKKTKTSKYTKRGRKLLAGSDAKTKNEKLAVLAKKTGYSTETLQKVYDRGLAAWRTGHRPGASQHAWAMARVYSFVTGGKTTKTADKDLVREAEIHFMTIERQLRRKYSDRLVEISIRGMSSKFIAGRARQWATQAAGAAQSDRIIRGGKGVTVSRDIGGAGGGRFVSQIQQAQQARANAIKAQRKANRLRRGNGARLSFGDSLFPPATTRRPRGPGGRRMKSPAETVGPLFGRTRDTQVKTADYFVGDPDAGQPRSFRFGPELLDDLTEARGSLGREAERMLQIRRISERLGVPFSATTPDEAEKHLKRMRGMNADDLAMRLVENGEYNLTPSGKVNAAARNRVKEMLSNSFINTHASHHEHAYNKYAEAWNDLIQNHADRAIEFAAFYPEARQAFQKAVDDINADPRTVNKITWQQAVMVAAIFSPENEWADSYNLNEINWKKNVGQAARALRDYARKGRVGGERTVTDDGVRYRKGYGFAKLTAWRIENAQKVLEGTLTPQDYEDRISRALLNKEGVSQKVPSFALNLLGYEHHFTDDRFMNVLAFGDFAGFTGKKGPKSTENKFDYPATRTAAQRIAQEMGWPVESTATIQAMLWGYQRDIVEGGAGRKKKTKPAAVRRIFTDADRYVPVLQEAASMRTISAILSSIYDPDADIEDMRNGIIAMITERVLDPNPEHQRFEEARLRDPKGGLTAAGRAYFKRKEGANLKPGVKGAADTPEKMRRKGSFLTRFYTNPSGPMVRPNGKPSRLALAAAAWGEPVPKTAEDARRLAAKGRRLLAAYERSKKKKA